MELFTLLSNLSHLSTLVHIVLYPEWEALRQINGVDVTETLPNLYYMWRSCLRHQSGNPEVVGSSPAGG